MPTRPTVGGHQAPQWLLETLRNLENSLRRLEEIVNSLRRNENINRGVSTTGTPVAVDGLLQITVDDGPPAVNVKKLNFESSDALSISKKENVLTGQLTLTPTVNLPTTTPTYAICTGYDVGESWDYWGYYPFPSDFTARADCYYNWEATLTFVPITNNSHVYIAMDLGDAFYGAGAFFNGNHTAQQELNGILYPMEITGLHQNVCNTVIVKGVTVAYDLAGVTYPFRLYVWSNHQMSVVGTLKLEQAYP